MATPKKQTYSMEDFESKYDDITLLYDLAEDLVATVESDLVADSDAQLRIVEPLINEIGDATDVLTQEFLYIAESKKLGTPTKASKKQIESTLRRVFTAINDYHNRVRNVTKKAHGAIMNIADPIVKKIQKHVEQVVAIFYEFVQLSLQSIMGKMELEALRARDTRIATMMHQYAMQQQQS